VVLRCEDHNLKELREIGDEIIDPRAFCCAPAVLALFKVVSKTSNGKKSERIYSRPMYSLPIDRRGIVTRCKAFGEEVEAWAVEVLARSVSRSTRKRDQLGENASSMK
jgi:hypothetical protein